MRTDLSNAADVRNTGVVKVLSHGVVAGPRFLLQILLWSDNTG